KVIPAGNACTAASVLSSVYTQLPAAFTVKLPCAVLAASAWKLDSPVSVSLTVTAPLAVSVTSSTTLPLVTPPIDAASFVPVIVMLTTCVVPSIPTPRSSYLKVIPAGNACTAASVLSSVYTQLPAASTVKLPCAVLAASAWKLDSPVS